MKLELKHIQHYPIGGYNALRITNEETCINERITGLFESSGDTYIYTERGDEYNIDDSFKLLLLPMSSLYKEMEDGTVPIVELAKMIGFYIKDVKIDGNGLLVQRDHVRYERYFQYDPSSRVFKIYTWDDHYTSDYLLETYSNPYLDIECWEYLFSHHFDIYGLIDKGLAIDKTKIK